jgi:N-acetylglutamate synthase-like GNAT family acetyltransferase
MIELLSKTSIRQAKAEDKPQIIELIIQFYKESLRDYGIRFDLETLYETVQNFIDNQIGIVAEKEDVIVGVIGGTIAPSMFDKSQKIGQEAIWYVTPDERKGSVGIKLILAFEQECIKRGANAIIMIHMSNLYPEILDRLYRINGFRLMESNYIKGVKNEII